MEVSAPQKLTEERNIYTVLSTLFEVPVHYRILSPLGFGTYGFVVSAEDTRTGKFVAIKKNSRIFRDLSDCKRIVRELLVLQHLKHDNILHLYDVYLPVAEGEEFRDIYMVSDLMDANLFTVIRNSAQPMNESHFKYFSYQILRGLKFLHSAGVMHRDLKPANILVNMNCDLQICDFGLARQFTQDAEMTDYVVTRYYRPPELLLMCASYTYSVDTWSAGCIIAELMTKQTLFKGADYVQQLDIILNTLRPTAEDLSFLETEQVAQHVFQRVEALRASWGEDTPIIAPSITNPVARDFIMKMLAFDPRKRSTPSELLRHPYLAELHDPTDEPEASSVFTWAYEGVEMSEELLRAELLRCARHFESENKEQVKQ